MLRSQPPAARPPIMLPTTKMLTVPSPGRIGSTNSFPATMVVSPDGRYAALLNDGYGTQETLAHQSIAILDLKSNQIADYPDARLSDEAHQSYFIGLAFSSDGKHLYASMGSLSDPTGAKAGDTGNGIAVYSFSGGKVAPERFIPIPLQPLAAGKKLAVGLTAPPHTAIPYPAGLAVIADKGHDKLLIANDLSDNAVLLDAATGKILQTFDLSTSDLVPSSFPYTCVATRNGRRAWCSLWNASQIVELDLTERQGGPLDQVSENPRIRWLRDRTPTALLLSPDEKRSTSLFRMMTKLLRFRPWLEPVPDSSQRLLATGTRRNAIRRPGVVIAMESTSSSPIPRWMRLPSSMPRNRKRVPVFRRLTSTGHRFHPHRLVPLRPRRSRRRPAHRHRQRRRHALQQRLRQNGLRD